MGAFNWAAFWFILVAGLLLCVLNFFLAAFGGHDSRAVPGKHVAYTERPWGADASYPKSWVHGIQTALLALACWAWTMPPIIAALVAIAIMLLYEVSQKVIDKQDVIANILGAGAAVGIVVLRAVFA